MRVSYTLARKAYKVDVANVLKDIQPENEVPSWKKAMGNRKSKEEKATDRKTALKTAFEACKFNGDVTIDCLVEYMGTTEKTVRNHIKEHGGFTINNNVVSEK